MVTQFFSFIFLHSLLLLATTVICGMASSIDSFAENTVVVVGGGLSGLVAARELEKACSEWSQCPISRIMVLEARDRFGGRIYSEHGVDLGPSWTWPRNDKALNKLATECNVSLEDQYVEGNALVHRAGGQVLPYGRNQSPAGEGSKRFQGGPSAIISNMVEELRAKPKIELRTNVAVRSVSTASDGSQGCMLQTFDPATQLEGESIPAAAVILAVPLQLIARSIALQPPLPAQQLQLMEGTETWMGNTGKIGFIFESRFWKARGNSGTAFSESGPMSQIWDASAGDGSTFALSSFVFDDALESLKDPDTALRKDGPVMEQLKAIFGEGAGAPKHVVYKAWDQDPFTVPSGSGSCSASGSVPFGHPKAIQPHHNIIFAGTESCPHENGHMNGAVLAGLRAAKDLVLLMRRRI